MSEKQFVELTYKKETPGTFVFSNENEGCIVPSVYIKKAAFPKGAPKSIKITIEVLP